MALLRAPERRSRSPRMTTDVVVTKEQAKNIFGLRVQVATIEQLQNRVEKMRGEEEGLATIIDKAQRAKCTVKGQYHEFRVLALTCEGAEMKILELQDRLNKMVEDDEWLRVLLADTARAAPPPR